MPGNLVKEFRRSVVGKSGLAHNLRARARMASPRVSRGTARPPGDVLSYNAAFSFPCYANGLHKSRKDSETHQVRKRSRSVREPTTPRNCREAGDARASSFPRSAAGSSLSQNRAKDCCPFSLKRPRTSWGKPHASFVKLIDVLTNGSSTTMEPFPGTLGRELIEFVPSSWPGDHYDWCIPSDTSSCSGKPAGISGQLPLHGILSEASLTVCSPPSCSHHDFSSDDVISFVVSEDYCDVGSVLDSMPLSREQGAMVTMGEVPISWMTSAMGTDYTTTLQASSEMRKEESSEEDYSIDLSEFKPDIDIYCEPDHCSSGEGCMQGLQLRLNYEDILNAWSDGGCLWADGKRPENVHVEW